MFSRPRKTSTALFGLWVLASTPAVADEVATTATAGGRHCSVGREVTLATLPPDEHFLLGMPLAMSPRGGLALVPGATGGFLAQPLNPRGEKRGKPQVLDGDWRELASVGDFFLAMGLCSAGRAGCTAARWLDGDGGSGPSLELATGERQPDVSLHVAGGRVHVLALRGFGSALTSDLLLNLGREADGTVQSSVHGFEAPRSPHWRFQEETDVPWFVAETSASAWYVDTAGNSGPILGWPSHGRLRATGPGRLLLLAIDQEHRTEWIVYALDVNRTLVERSRGAPGPKPPAPFLNAILADETTRDGIPLVREVEFGDPLSPTLLTSHPSPTPGRVIWANGQFFATYAERAKRAVTVKLRAVSCR